jgi:thiamine pyrophosphokinase
MVINMSNCCYIVGAGEFCGKMLPECGDYVIAADGGYAALKLHGIVPDLIVGDFDSLPPYLLDEVKKHPNIIYSPVEKDDTDMMLAVKQGLKLGYDHFVINGGLGGRLDQTLANIQILTFIAENDARGTLIGSEVCITAIKNSDFEIIPDFAKRGIISIFSMGGKAEGVTLKGLKYPLSNATITSDTPIGVSNELTGMPACVSVQNGILVIMYDLF